MGESSAFLTYHPQTDRNHFLQISKISDLYKGYNLYKTAH